MSPPLRTRNNLQIDGDHEGRPWSSLWIIARRRCSGCFRSLALGGRSPKIAGSLRPRSAAWYHKREPSFSDAMAAVRRRTEFINDPDGVEIPAALWERLTEAPATRHKFCKVELRWTMISGRGGMGSHKHGVNGRAPRSPRGERSDHAEAQHFVAAVGARPLTGNTKLSKRITQ